MRFKLYIITLLCMLSIFISFNAYADDVLRVDRVEMNNGFVTINGTAKNPNTWVSVAIFRKSTGNVFYVNEVCSDTNGFFEISLSLPGTLKNEDTSGVFQIVASSELSVDNSQTFEYVSENARKSFFDNLSAENIKQELDKEENAIVFQTLGVDIDSYNTKLSSEQKNAAFEFFIQNTPWSDITIDNLSRKINCGIYATMIQAGKTADALIGLNILYDEIKYMQITDAEHQKFIYDHMGGVRYATEKELNDQYQLYYSLYLLNHAKTSEIVSLLYKHKDALAINDSSTYNAVSALVGDMATKAGRKFVQLTDEKVLTSKGELAQILTEVYNDLYKSETETGTGSTGGFGGGGGGGTSSGSQNGMTIGLPTKDSAVEPETPNQTETSPNSDAFSDIDSVPWAKEAIHVMAQRNIINGTGDGRFLPENKVSREEFVKMLVLSLGTYHANGRCSFADVSEENWAYTYIASAVNAGYVKGIDEQSFGLGEYVTRQDAAVFIARALQLVSTSQITTFEDDAEISDYAKDAVYAMCEKGVVNGIGDNYFAPKECCTRAESAKMIYFAILSGGVR